MGGTTNIISHPPSNPPGKGAFEPPKERERTCVATGESLPESLLVRFVQGPDGALVPDVAAKLPGRGVWVRADRASIDLAVKRNGFARGLKHAVKPPTDLADQTEALLVRRCLDFIGLAKRAGALAIGVAQAEGAIRKRQPFGLIEASDGADDGRIKLQRLIFGLWGVEPPITGCFTSAEMGLALGRDHVVHAVLLTESMAHRWSIEIARLAGFRAIIPASWPPPSF
ncbi:MAG: RNA-binding protein [Hyphomonadaceae bacterium]|nr:RNA-binding protein [Hyphomonadaceae bacterium]